MGAAIDVAVMRSAPRCSSGESVAPGTLGGTADAADAMGAAGRAVGAGVAAGGAGGVDSAQAARTSEAAKGSVRVSFTGSRVLHQAGQSPGNSCSR